MYSYPPPTFYPNTQKKIHIYIYTADLPPNRVAELMWKATGIRKTGDQCRTRWTKVDDPSIRKGSWTAKEDELLSTAVRDKSTGEAPPPWVAVSQSSFWQRLVSHYIHTVVDPQGRMSFFVLRFFGFLFFMQSLFWPEVIDKGRKPFARYRKTRSR